MKPVPASVASRWPKVLTHRQRKAATLLTQGIWSVQDVAAAIRAHPSTVSHWRRDPRFVALEAEARARFDQALIEARVRQILDGERLGRPVRTKPRHASSPNSLRNLRSIAWFNGLKRKSKPGQDRESVAKRVAERDVLPVLPKTLTLSPESLATLAMLRHVNGANTT